MLNGMSMFATNNTRPSDNICTNTKRDSPLQIPMRPCDCLVPAQWEELEAEDVDEVVGELPGNAQGVAVVCTRVEMACSRVEVLHGKSSSQPD